MGQVDYFGEGYLKTCDDLEKYRSIIPSPIDNKMYKEAKEFLATYKKDYAIFAALKFGIEHTFISMQIDKFFYMLYDNPKLVQDTMEMLSDWFCEVLDLVQDIGFDGIYIADDIAIKNGPLMNPKQFNEFLYPYMKKCAEKIVLPWIYHSCGNMMPLMREALSLGMNGLANIEPGPMDIFEVKENFGHEVCLVGNIDLHYTLTIGSVEETIEEVKEKIKKLAPGGGYIIASSNGLTSYVKLENLMAMNETLKKFGKYPINNGSRI
jgi:uroporphyrinogen-III decarboxylase